MPCEANHRTTENDRLIEPINGLVGDIQIKLPLDSLFLVFFSFIAAYSLRSYKLQREKSECMPGKILNSMFDFFFEYGGGVCMCA